MFGLRVRWLSVAKEKVTMTTIRNKYLSGQKLTMVTAYDFSSGSLVDQAGADLVLVGDSVGMVCLGMDSTTGVTMEHMVHHCMAVSRGVQRAFVVGDLPFGSYLDEGDALRNSVRLVQTGGVASVKLEGGFRVIKQVQAVVQAGIPVLGHIGLTPQTASSLGGFKVQGKSAEAAVRLFDDAQALQEAGVWGIVLEAVPDRIADYITRKLKIPTIGIGAGPKTSGQVQVFHDILGLYDKFQPKFSKRYARLGSLAVSALNQYVTEVRGLDFPEAPHHTFSIKQAEYDMFVQALNDRKSQDSDSESSDDESDLDSDEEQLPLYTIN